MDIGSKLISGNHILTWTHWNQLDAFCCLLPGHVMPSLVDTFVPVLRCRMVPLGSMDHVMHTEFSLSTSSISSLGWKLVGSRVSKCPVFSKNIFNTTKPSAKCVVVCVCVWKKLRDTPTTCKDPEAPRSQGQIGCNIVTLNAGICRAWYSCSHPFSLQTQWFKWHIPGNVKLSQAVYPKWNAKFDNFRISSSPNIFLVATVRGRVNQADRHTILILCSQMMSGGRSSAHRGEDKKMFQSTTWL